MKNGKLAETGNHEEILEKYPNGIYAGFCDKQRSAEQQKTGNES
jgi:ABC-type multidrug transport system fused ATPase/permease subunit